MTQSPSSLPGPDDITRRELPNGIVVLVRENHASPSIALSSLLPAGAVFETRETAGLANLTAAALMRGTARRDFQTLYEEVESIGASLSFSGGMHSARIYGRSLAEDLPTLLDVMADALCNPTFPPAQVERLRGEAITWLHYREQDTRQRASMAFRALAYPDGHPYGRSTRGYLETVSDLDRDAVAAFHQKHYGPRGMILVIVGAVRAEEAVNQVAAALGGWRNPGQPDLPALPALPPMADARRENVPIPDKTQADIVMGVPGPSRFAPDWWGAVIANNILGVFGLMGRIGGVVREQLGLAYYAYSQLNGGPGPGAWEISAGVNPANIERAIAKITEEVARMAARPVAKTELEENKSYFTGSLPLNLESNEGVAGALLHMERYGLGLDYLRRYADTVRAVTREDVRAAAQRYLGQPCAVAVAGPSLP